MNSVLLAVFQTRPAAAHRFVSVLVAVPVVFAGRDDDRVIAGVVGVRVVVVAAAQVVHVDFDAGQRHAGALDHGSLDVQSKR